MTGGSGLYLTGVFAFAMLTASAAFLLFRKKVK
jgi:LPXTG-motif cell wall-anchored protein